MGMTDPIADMLTRIRNASRIRFKSVDVLMSGVNLSIAETLKKAGYISGYEVVKGEKKTHSMLKIYLKYSPASKQGIIKNIQRVSKPGRRVYANSRKIPTVLNGYGIAIVSTSRGVLTDKEARGLNVGGEILCNVW